MPILKREPDRFPAAVFDLAPEEHPWSVAHLRSRQEKALARKLVDEAVPFYLPQSEQRIRRNNRTFVSHLPLFGGYLFLRANRSQMARVLRSDVIVRVLDVPDQETLQHELSQLYALQQSGASLIPYPYIGVGDGVHITEGPFEGFRGVVVRAKGAMRLVVAVSFLRQSVAVDFDRDVLVPLEKSGVSLGSNRLQV